MYNLDYELNMKTLVNIGKLDEFKIQDDVPSVKKIDKVYIKSPFKKWCTVSVIVLTVLFVVATTTFIGIHFLHYKHDETKRFELTVHYENGEHQSEKVVLTDTEEVFETKDVHLIYDLSSGLVVLSFKDDPDFADCYVDSFNISEVPTPRMLKKQYQDSKIDLTVGDESLKERFVVTDIWLNIEALGPRSREICQGKDVYFLKKRSDNNTRVKRQKQKIKKKRTKGSVLWGLFKWDRTVEYEQSSKPEESSSLSEGI